MAEKIVVSGNEFYEIDLECIKRKQEGKDCIQSRKTAYQDPVPEKKDSFHASPGQETF